MKLLALGTLLVLYAIFLTPAYFEPADLVISTAYVATWTAMGWPTWLLFIWIASGYIALCIGLALGVHFLFRVKHPVLVALVASFIGLIVFYYFFIVNGVITI